VQAVACSNSSGEPLIPRDLPVRPSIVVLVAHNEPKRTLNALAQAGIPVETANIPPGGGDFIWAIRAGTELYITGHVAERKQVEDLTSSILSDSNGRSRYVEQKYYLWHSGVRRLMLIVEGDTSRRQIGAASQNTALMALTASASSLAEGYSVWQTRDLLHTSEVVRSITTELQKVAIEKEALLEPRMQWRKPERTFEAWCAGLKELRRQQHSLRLVSIRMLQQIPGLRSKQISTMVEYFPTYGALQRALRTAEGNGSAKPGSLQAAIRLLLNLTPPRNGASITQLCARRIATTILGKD